MGHPLQVWMKAAGFESKSTLARRILARVPGLFPETAAEQRHRRIGLQLTRLEQGSLSWWRGNEEALRVLADLLGISEQHLLQGGPTMGLVEFDEFPVLRPMDPATELPPRGTGWAMRAATSERETEPRFDLFTSLPETEAHVWIQVPPGAGKSLAARVRTARSQLHGSLPLEESPREPESAPVFGPRAARVQHWFTVLTAHRLADLELSRFSTRTPLFIEVGFADPQTDREALQSLRDWKSVVVVASFARPGSADVLSYDPEWRMDRREWAFWQDLEWRPMAGWRQEVIDWAASRLGTERKGLLPREFGTWLEQADPGERLVRTPGELLTLCHLAHEMGTRRLVRQFADGWKEDVSRTVVPRMLKREMSEGSVRASWLRAAGADAVRTLTLAAFRDVASPWPPSATVETWAGRLPEIYAAPVSDKVLDEKLLAIARGRNENERKQRAREAKASIHSLSPAMAIEYLSSTRLMRLQPDGGLGPYPHWMVETIARQQVEEGLLRLPTTWGRWAADPGRQHLVDEVLDALPSRRLLSLSEQVVREHDGSELGSVGAVDALFSAWGRRLEKEPAASDALETLHALALRQLEVLGGRSGRTCPMTRPGFGEGSNAWLADCWSWSFAVPPPAWPVAPELRWHFPGWTSPALSDEGAWCLSWVERVKGRVDQDYTRLVARASRVLEYGGPTLPPRGIPYFLLPAFMVSAAHHDIALVSRLIAQAVQQDGFVEELLQRLQQEGPLLQRALAASVFHGLAKEAGGVMFLFEPQARTSYSTPERHPIAPTLAEWLFTWLDDAAIVRTLQESGPGHLPFKLERVPPRLLLHLVRHYVQHKPRELLYFTNLNVHRFKPEHIPVLELLTEKSMGGVAAYNALWRLAPEVAFQKAFDAQGQYLLLEFSLRDDLSNVFPRDWYGRILDALESCPREQWPIWSLDWLASRIRAGGALVERAYALHRRGKAEGRPG
ncbi:hypothetical protein D187_008173 [Cystobacter fuscus DSM 2262]|uniref:Uncharacterized protein n=1 Tax=Cystobacter fuscus (strain ATCC 25194 / DSM 2262 / NBRC 100088 / M29) TaxID=1242864 RepID=S9QHK2_CYSF2|nr:hypothetical protein [Cystobacter fuscus]EPX55918.1 hypothetical protein D187_008173 [Cystobacter fuscus DSM 2262]